MGAIIKCKMCGGELALTAGSTIATCEYCGTVQTVPSMDDEKKLLQFERAERLRKNCDFDKAAGIYESIVADFRYEAEAYWSLVLCKYGIEYVDDPATGKKVPTCHRSSFDSVMEDSNFEQTLENANASSRKIYREEAKQIEEIRKGIVAVSNNEEPYDIFICYKETAENGERTIDSVLAQDIYDALSEKGYRVFFSRITLEDKLGQEYEPYIFAALNSAKVMLAIGTDYEYFNAVWVKNEWSRFLKLMEKDKSKHLIPCFKDIDAYDMPKEFSKFQAQDLGKVGAVQDLLRGIDKLIIAKPATQTAQLSEDDVRREYLYNSALEAAQKKNPKQVRDAIKKLESLGDWKDAQEQLQVVKKNLKRIRATITAILLVVACLVGIVVYRYEQSVRQSNYDAAQRREFSMDDYVHNNVNERVKILEDVVKSYRKAKKYKDAEEKTATYEQELAAAKQELTALKEAMLKLVQGDDPNENYVACFYIDGIGTNVTFWIDQNQLTDHYDAMFALYAMIDNSFRQQQTTKEFQDFYKAGGGSCCIGYDLNTQAFLFRDVSQDPTILFYGKLNDDGSVTLYNDAGITYKLIPMAFYKNGELFHEVVG